VWGGGASIFFCKLLGRGSPSGRPGGLRERKTRLLQWGTGGGGGLNEKGFRKRGGHKWSRGHVNPIFGKGCRKCAGLFLTINIGCV